MKTKKVVARSPMQMTIVAFVLLFVAITATILVMYFKWFANDQLGAPAAVNVVGEDKVEVVEVVNEEDPFVLPELTDWNTLENKENLVPGFMYDGAKNIVYLFMKDLDGKEYLVWQKKLVSFEESLEGYTSEFLFISDYEFLYVDGSNVYVYNLNTGKELVLKGIIGEGSSVRSLIQNEKLDNTWVLVARTQKYLYWFSDNFLVFDLNTGDGYVHPVLKDSPPQELLTWFSGFNFYFQLGNEVIFGIDTSGYLECYPDDGDSCACGDWRTSYFIFNEKTKEFKYKKVDTTACQPRTEFGDNFDISKYEAIVAPKTSHVGEYAKTDSFIKILANQGELSPGPSASILNDYFSLIKPGDGMVNLYVNKTKEKILWGEKLLGDLKFEW